MDVVNNTPSGKLHPILWVAAIAVTLFSLVGIGAVTGVIQTGKSEAPAAPAPAAVAAQTPPAPVAPVTINQNVAAPAEKPAAKVAAAAPRQRESVPHVRRVSRSDSDIDVYSSEPRRYDDRNDRYGDRQQRPAYTASSDGPYYPPSQQQQQQQAACYDCGVVDSVTPVVEKGQGTGLGGVLGGVAGAVVGNQIGHGGGRTVARILGAGAGAYAGNEIEKSQRSNTYYDIAVRLDEGGVRHVRSDTPPAWQAGDRVRFDNGRLIPR